MLRVGGALSTYPSRTRLQRINRRAATVTRLSRNSSMPVLVVAGSCELKRGPVEHARCTSRCRGAHCLLLLPSVDDAGRGLDRASLSRRRKAGPIGCLERALSLVVRPSSAGGLLTARDEGAG